MSNTNITGGDGSTLPPSMQNESKPVRLLYSVVAGLGTLVTVLAAIPDVPRLVVIIVAGVAAVLTAALGRYTETKTVPLANTKSIYIDSTGQTVAGPAAALKTGTVVEEPVASNDTGKGWSPSH
jgi:hypothetical protein